MRKIECCFSCTTPYQIISATFIAISSKKSADIYIHNFFNGAAECAERLSKTGIFSKVRLVDLPQLMCIDKNRIWRYIKRTLMCLNYKKYVHNFLIDDTIYSEIYISSWGMHDRIRVLYFLKHYPTTELVGFDDGAGSYFNDNLINLRPIEIPLWRMLLNRRQLKKIAVQWLYMPQLYCKLHHNQSKNVRKIPIDNNAESYLNIFNKIFNFKESDKINEHVIVFGISTREYLQKELKEISSIYKIIFSFFTNDDVIIKKHPRDKSSPVAGYKYYKKTYIPFECLCMNIDLSDRLLISFSSTAVTSPKLLFNQEPYVILLYKLVHNKGRDFIDEDHYYQACKTLYEAKDKFFIPETFDELNRILEKLSRKIGN